NRTYRPMAFVRIVRPLKGAPRIRVRLNPAVDYGAHAAARTAGSNHIRYLVPSTLRLTTNAPVSNILEQRVFRLETETVFFLGPDEEFGDDLIATTRAMRENTRFYWRNWARMLATPLEWQECVIRAAITL